MDKYIGKRLDGRYEIESLIGVGGMANVYRAKDLLESRTVAVKILRDEFMDNEELVRRFKNESKAISILDHPNIVRVFDVSVSDKTYFIVMEYIDGITLKEYMVQRAKPLTWKEALHFTTQLLQALQHAHERGIVHRDVKPQNVMLLADGSIRVMDFGIARFSRAENMTLTDKAIGSVHYISPEQAKGDATDAKADIYSVGVMLYEMLTGKVPFDSDSPVQVAIKQISDKPAPMRQKNPEIPEALESITMRAMAKEPSERYQSAQEMLRDIEEFKKNPSIRFEYQYLTDNSPTRFIDSVMNTQKTKPSQRPAARAKSKNSRKNFLPMLAGVTAAFMVCCLILVIIIFKNSKNPLFSNIEDVQLPDFVGQSYSAIQEDKANKNFEFRVVESYQDEYKPGTVYAQSPKPPKVVKETSRVTLYVSKGQQVVSVPDISGMTRSDAQRALADLDLKVRIEPLQDASVPVNRVVRTDPVNGTQLYSGDTVTLYISTKIPQSDILVPNLIGLSLDDARKVLSQNKLNLGTYVEVENGAPLGTIIAQSYKEGDKVVVGTAINVQVSLGYVQRNITINISFDKNALNMDWVATMNGTQVSTFHSANGAANWSFTVSGTRGVADMVIAGGGQTYSFGINFDNQTTVSFNIAGKEPPVSSSGPSSGSGSSSTTSTVAP